MTILFGNRDEYMYARERHLPERRPDLDREPSLDTAAPTTTDNSANHVEPVKMSIAGSTSSSDDCCSRLSRVLGALNRTLTNTSDQLKLSEKATEKSIDALTEAAKQQTAGFTEMPQSESQPLN